MALYEYDLEDRRAALANHLGLPIEEVVPSKPFSGVHLGDVYTNEFYTPDGTFVVLDDEDATKAMVGKVHSVMEEDELAAFSEEFTDWILENAIDDYPIREYCGEYYYDDAYSLRHDKDDEYGNYLNRYCVENGLISGFDVVDGEYQGDEDLEDLYTEYCFDAAENNYSSFSDWYAQAFGEDELVSLCVNWHLFDEEAIADELISRDGYGTLAEEDGLARELEASSDPYSYGSYYAFKMDDEDRRAEAEEE